MQNLWNDEIAAAHSGDLGQRIYSSRLLGRDKSLVLHGGGNASVKIREKNLFGEEQTVLYVKGSGWDLEHIEAEGFAPLRLEPLERLVSLPALSDAQMLDQLAANLLAASAPRPSLETLLHACLPAKFVDHTHADAVLAVNDAIDGEARIRDLYSDCCVIVPYRRPGFGLAQAFAAEFARHRTAKTIGAVLLHHGMLSFGESARESYQRMIELVARAENYLARRNAWTLETAPVKTGGAPQPLAQAQLRARIAAAAGAPMIVKTCTDARTLAFAQHPALARISQQGPITPDHVIRTKRAPMLGGDAERYAAEYRRYYEEHAGEGKDRVPMLDPAPRIALDPAYGLAAAGKTAPEAAIAEEIYAHTIDTILRAEALGGYRALSERDIFEVEYWGLEQDKLAREAKPFAGEVALITGAASGIGKAAVASFLARGAAVAGLDLNAAVESLHTRPDFLGIRCDLTDAQALSEGITRAVLRYGGLDMLVLNAGIFSASRKIAELSTDEWRRVMAINLDANFALLRACHPYLKLAPRGGRVVVIGPKNVPAPGPGAAAYSASKAGLNQLARVVALEWGEDRIRINSLHPNAVFDTGLWTEEVLAQRAKHYGMSVERYKTNNVLRVEVTSRDVAELAAEMCGELFAKTTGAQVPVDGGNERVI
ncbi:MAG: bifunctional aldolase/short-chain dehydrogenase [Betaproteobacteria bacterium]|nr:bifunctional aldolase/short-chain dehydrogenase [Betaproteobacteria bacterium]